METAKKTRTISGILWEKFLDSVENSSWGEMFWIAVKVAASSIIATLLLNIQDAWQIALFWMTWHDLAIPKVAASIGASFGWRIWHGAGRIAYRHVKESIDRAISALEPKDEEAQTWYGVPVVELVDHIFETGTFKRDEVEEKFALPRNRFDEMSKRMDKVGIFKRGENNARVLNRDFSRADVSNILRNATEGEDLRLIRKDGESSYTHAPSMGEIRARHLSPASESGFVISEIPELAS